MLFKPHLSCLKKIGPFEDSFIIIANKGKIKLPNKIKNSRENTISKLLFKILFSFLSKGKSPTFTTGRSPILFIYNEDDVNSLKLGKMRTLIFKPSHIAIQF